MTFVRRKSAEKAATVTPLRHRPDDDVHIKLEPRQDVGSGMFEITVTVDDQKTGGSTLILTSPRDFAFRKTA